MKKIELFYATNRAHTGKKRNNPDSYGSKPSSDGGENLRFGRVTLDNLDDKKINECLKDKLDYGVGNGVDLSDYYLSQIKNVTIHAIEDGLDTDIPDISQKNNKLGSVQTFLSLKKKMSKSCDVVIYIHGYSVSWEDAVASAMALQTTLNVDSKKVDGKEVVVILFSWPSDGQKYPIYSYKSDRADAEFSGSAFGRGILKLRDFLMKERTREDGVMLCNQEVHLLCHSMGNYVLQNTLKRLIEFNHGMRLPRLFDQIFMCSPDVDDDALEKGKPLARLQELATNVNIYHNSGDVAMYISDYTKQNSDRLGLNGVEKVAQLSQKVHQIDCSKIVTGMVEHSYYLNGNVNEDIRHSIAGVNQDDTITRQRTARQNAWPNVWVMK
ncbi:MAG: hypothetical protein DIZ80_00560 [endosymbiont of Galathealinum brachiosum]|uniref:Alpha/beta hydrolase n=1 Tax=endosymbiont of Galathealinum brachiosum TaxID=2200906 RepID=A0A370DM81_9GAMM|nr:MAG: hypothetical protein DIZ80_00560 [endosymbiont of Galathealinum brachiosum]